jgi:NAD(P)-dependent dehydrogenase (short-subunit alcohol dehydrogenase family)
MLAVQYARAPNGILVNAADPGFTATDFNSHRGTQSVAVGTDAIVRLATLPRRSDRNVPRPSRDGPLVATQVATGEDKRRSGGCGMPTGPRLAPVVRGGSRPTSFPRTGQT